MSRSIELNLSPKIDPETRIKQITILASEVNFNKNFRATQYVQSGKEMLRSANNYLEDGNIEHAYILYMRFLTIFLEKLHTHPGFKEIPLSDRSTFMKNCKLILPKTEELRKQLLIQFKEEHEEYLEYRRREEEEEKRNEEARKKKFEQDAKISDMIASVKPKPASAPPLSSLRNNVERERVSSTVPSIFDNEHRNAAMVPVSSNDISFPSVDRTTKPSRLLSPISSGLRQVIIPGNLASEFMKLAQVNTRINIETCGNLTGKIIRDRLVITHLIIPKQSGTANSCTTEDEFEIFEHQDKMDLITLGWVHTHPTQSSFLSSVDLHSSYGFQISMPEAIAIVCAPQYNSVGVYTLSPFGMEVVGNCTEVGFHPHPQNSEPLFYEATHTSIENEREIKIIDLRSHLR